LTACLRTGRALRVPRARTRGRGKSHVAPDVMISERPAEAADRPTGSIRAEIYGNGLSGAVRGSRCPRTTAIWFGSYWVLGW